MVINKSYRDKFAYDISKDVIKRGEVWDANAINQSIELILTTVPGERLFNVGFGSPLSRFLFEGMTETTAENLINQMVDAIKMWEDRVTVIEPQIRLTRKANENAVVLDIPYVINRNNIVSKFQKKIVF